MNNLIDRRVLLDKLPKPTDERITQSGAVADMICLIMSAPTIDAESVRYGKWIKDRPHHHVCSECKAQWGMAALMMNFCPTCGAKMLDIVEEDGHE